MNLACVLARNAGIPAGLLETRPDVETNLDAAR
jgi:hypothetical protein